MNDDEFLAKFENCTLPAELWTHQAHVQVAYLYATRETLTGATDRIRAAIKAYAQVRKTPSAIDQGYHETVTAAFMQIVYAASLQTGPHPSSHDFCATHPELLDSHALRKYYSREHLMTWNAKESFVDADRCPLPMIIGDSTTIVHAADSDSIEAIVDLMTEYAESLDYQFCFAGFDAELSGLPGAYGLPGGRLLLARYKDESAGCVAMKPSGGPICEMKRLWVRPGNRNSGLGRHLASAAIRAARTEGYAAMRLETDRSMTAAIQLYESLGFHRIDPYADLENKGVVPMQLELAASSVG